jgi:hypothetical protein
VIGIGDNSRDFRGRFLGWVDRNWSTNIAWDRWVELFGRGDGWDRRSGFPGRRDRRDGRL